MVFTSRTLPNIVTRPRDPTAIVCVATPRIFSGSWSAFALISFAYGSDAALSTPLYPTTCPDTSGAAVLLTTDTYASSNIWPTTPPLRPTSSVSSVLFRRTSPKPIAPTAPEARVTLVNLPVDGVAAPTGVLLTVEAVMALVATVEAVMALVVTVEVLIAAVVTATPAAVPPEIAVAAMVEF